MRKMVNPNTAVDTFTPEEASPHKIYAGINESGHVCVAVRSDERHRSEFRMMICEGDGFNAHNLVALNRYLVSCSLPSLLKWFPRQKHPNIYEFDTFVEFCQWVVDVKK